MFSSREPPNQFKTFASFGSFFEELCPTLKTELGSRTDGRGKRRRRGNEVDAATGEEGSKRFFATR
jgi:hypothetical protein